MTEDIVTRIREQANAGYIDEHEVMLHIAADEIERLRAEINALCNAQDGWGRVPRLEAEIERLRERNTILFDALQAVTKGKAVYFTNSSGKTVKTDAQNSWMGESQ